VSRAYGRCVANGTHQGPVLIAYDGSDHAKAAIADAALELGRGRRAIVLTVYSDLERYTPAIVPADPPPPGLTEVAAIHARKLAAEGAELARSLGFDASARVESGDPIWRRVIDVADEVDASLVVVGSHGRTGIARVLLGSVAAATASHSDRDVLVVRRPKETS
jgi:nucleotide-binding universal stress UspA family protein